MAILRVLYLARSQGVNAAVDAETIRTETRIGFDEFEMLLQKMLEAGWVGRIKSETAKRTQFGKRITEGRDAWILLVNPQQLHLADVYRLFVFNTSGDVELIGKVEDAIEQGLNQTLAGYFISDRIETRTTLVQSASAST
jgi:membrane protein